MIVVFLNNKLISCDSILPLLYEAKAGKGNGDVEFYCFNIQTLEAIRSNEVLYDLINRLGRLVLISKKASTRLGILAQRFRTLGLIARVAALALVGRATFIHFKALDDFPWRVLYLLNKKRTFYCESSAIGFTDREDKLMLIQGKKPSQPENISASALIRFHESWKIPKHPDAKNIPIYDYGCPRGRQHWLNFIQDESDMFFEKAFSAAGVKNTDEIAVYILSYMGGVGFMKDPESMKSLVHETLSILSDLNLDMPLFLKPHATTDQSFIREAASEYPNLNIIITGLHPAVLATRARYFIANHYSSTFYDAHTIGVPTVEYTQYSDDVTQAMNKESIRPEFVSHFIQRDPDMMRKVLLSLESKSQSKLPTGPTSDPSGLLEMLSAC